MPTVIRMRRGGRTHKPFYRIVVQDSRERDRGPEIDTLGYYHPCARPEPVSEVNAVKTLQWLRKGAQPSDTARSLFKKVGVMKHFYDGTEPEEAVTAARDEAPEAKNLNAPPPPEPVEEAEAPAAEAEAPAAEAEAPAAEAEAPAAEAEAPAAGETSEETAEPEAVAEEGSPEKTEEAS